jgi:replicative DNA helicase
MRTLLTSEGEDWTTYLEEVRSKQGKSFETGFVGLDERAGGLTTGVMLLVDTDRDRISAFLKQFTDQVAVRSKVPCLFLSYHLPKAAMRVRTLARLSAVAARDIEKGRLKKGSPELESVEKNGREAAVWLKSIFVVDGDPEIDLGAITDMIETLRAPSEAGTCLVVVDSLERLAEGGDTPSAVLAGLKELASTQDVLVVVGTTDRTLSSQPGLDFQASLSSGLGNASQLEVLPAGESRPTVIRFEYLPEICRFTEQPAA